MTDATPDYAGLIERLRKPGTWARHGDDIIASDAKEELVRDDAPFEAAAALRTLLERNAALERERTNLIETKREQIGRLQKERDEQWKRADTLAQQNAYHKDRAEAAEAERDRLKKRVAELEKALEPFAREAEDWCPEANGGHVFDDAESIAGETSITVGHLRTARAYRDKRSKQ